MAIHILGQKQPPPSDAALAAVRATRTPLGKVRPGARVRAAAMPPGLEQGFRPFFLLGATFAVAAVPVWLVALRGGFQPGGAFGALHWHAHEMLFGFSTAIIAGFLLTAVRNWTGRETVTGWPLAGLAALWVLGRVCFFFAARLPPVLTASVELGFLPLLAAICARALLAAQSRRNYGFIALLLGLTTANGVAHWSALHGDLASVHAAHGVALDIIVLMLVLVTGRVVPMFTRNATQLAWIRGEPRADRAALAVVALLTLSDIWPSARWLSATLAGVAAALLVARMRYWGSRHTGQDPLLWLLHVGVAWLPVGLLLRVGAALSPHIPTSSALHALTAGAIGSLTLGMMARVSLGHTGRLLRAPRGMTIGFWCLVGASLVRVAAPFLPSAQYLAALTVAASAWSSAFVLFLLSYGKILLGARANAD